MVDSYPHCDSLVLHKPGICKFCDGHPDWQQDRINKGINFTGEADKYKQTDPATIRRPIETINRWYGNRPWDAESERALEEWKAELERLFEEYRDVFPNAG